jgi:hypothetical protein
MGKRMNIPPYRWEFEGTGPRSALDARELAQITAPLLSLGWQAWLPQILSEQHPALRGATESLAARVARGLLGPVHGTRLIAARIVFEQDEECICSRDSTKEVMIEPKIGWQFLWDGVDRNLRRRLERALRPVLQNAVEQQEVVRSALLLMASETCPALAERLSQQACAHAKSFEGLVDPSGDFQVCAAHLRVERQAVHKMMDSILREENRGMRLAMLQAGVAAA